MAFECHFGIFYDFSRNQTSFLSPSVFVRETAASDTLNQELAVIIDHEEHLDFRENQVSSSLLQRAHLERDSSIKFLLLWMTLESVIGNGKERKAFSMEIMKSEALDTAINHLRSRRDNMVHDGADATLDHLDFLRIKTIIMMGLTINPALRAKLLDYLLNTLADAS